MAACYLRRKSRLRLLLLVVFLWGRIVSRPRRTVHFQIRLN